MEAPPLALSFPPRTAHIARTMGLFDKKKKEKIPDVGGYDNVPPPSAGGSSRPGYAQSPNSYASSQYSNAGGPPSYRSPAPTYVPPSQGGNGYNQASHYARPMPPQQGYPQQGPPPPQTMQQQGPPPVGAKEKSGKWGFGGSKNKVAEQEARNELFAGAPPPGQYNFRQGQDPYANQGGVGAGASRDQGGYPGGQQQEQQFENEEDEEVEGIKQQLKFTKQESLASTRNAVRIAREAEETARATLDKLGDQSGSFSFSFYRISRVRNRPTELNCSFTDRIANTERHLDLAKAHNDRAVDETKELEALNRSIFRPNSECCILASPLRDPR